MTFKTIVKEILRKPYRLHLRRKLKARNFTLIASNCLGGVLYHDLGEKFLSPTINMTVKPFLPFLQELKGYIQCDTPPCFQMYHEVQGYPVLKLGDITLNGVHYKTPEAMIADWEKRKARINWDNIFIITTDEYIRTEEELEQFAQLPWPKVLYTSKPRRKYDFEVYVPGYEDRECVGDILRYHGITGARQFEYYFDCVSWLNTNSRSH